MADTKISLLPAGSIPTGSEITNVVQGGNAVQMPLSMLRSNMSNQSTASQSPAAATTTYLTNSSITTPTSGLRVGTVYRWRVIATKTAAGTAASSFLIKLGTNGTTADTTLATLTVPAGTAVADTAWFDILVTIRGPLGASAIAQCSLTMQHNLSATGWSTIPTVVVTATSPTFNSATSGLIMGLAFTAGTAVAATMVQVTAEAYNLG